jgi:hypothetical protein
MPAIIKVESPSEEGKESIVKLIEKQSYIEFPIETKNPVRSGSDIYLSEREIWNHGVNFGLKLNELKKSDQEALAKAWEEGFTQGRITEYRGYPEGKPKNPYTKE